jgi:hypothetical protein
VTGKRATLKADAPPDVVSPSNADLVPRIKLE